MTRDELNASYFLNKVGMFIATVDRNPSGATKAYLEMVQAHEEFLSRGIEDDAAIAAMCQELSKNKPL